jgi:hypothetical protein
LSALNNAARHQVANRLFLEAQFPDVAANDPAPTNPLTR